MHHLSPADDAVPGTSSGDHTYEEIKDEMLGIIINIKPVSLLNISYYYYNIITLINYTLYVNL